MKFTFIAFRILMLLAAFFFLFSFASTAQTPRYDDDRNPPDPSRSKPEILTQFAATKPSVSSLVVTGTPQVAGPSAASCANMLSLDIPDTEITSAQMIPADPGNNLPEYCDVLGFTQHTIGFDVRMPTIWNGKMYFAGNFVFAGHIPRGQTKKGLTRNYATVSTDTGHQDADILDASWALNNRQAEIDFGFRAVHETTLLGKIIISNYYGGAPKFSYFDGCSTGGAQALREAELFPEDFDGYIAGAPVLDFTGNFLAQNWKMQALHATPDSDLIPLEKLSVIGNAVLEKCDAIDGLRDGLIEDPRKCDFEPATLLCKNGDGPNCLTKSETHALQLIYQGPRNSFGLQLYPGLVKGGETPDGTGNGNGWEAMINTPGSPSFEFIIQDQFFRYLAFRVDNPNYDWSTFNFNTDPQRLDFMGDILNATSTNLSRFHKLGRKLLMYHGWSDATVSPLRTIEYYRGVRNRLGKEETRDSIRLFMAPGMYHCSAGPGPDTFDRIAALEQWVEQGVAPEEMEATHFDINGSPDRTRPLCAYPKVAHYDGSGSIDEAANFSCVAPTDDDRNEDKD